MPRLAWASDRIHSFEADGFFLASRNFWLDVPTGLLGDLFRRVEHALDTLFGHVFITELHRQIEAALHTLAVAGGGAGSDLDVVIVTPADVERMLDATLVTRTTHGTMRFLGLPLENERPIRDSNPCRRRERAVS